MVFHFFLVFLALAVEFVDEAIDRGIHVFLHIVGVQIATADVQCCFRAVAQFFNGEYDMYVQCLIEMPVPAALFFR